MSDSPCWCLAAAVNNGSQVCLADHTHCPLRAACRSSHLWYFHYYSKGGIITFVKQWFFHGIQWKKLDRCHCHGKEVPAQAVSVEVALLFGNAASQGHIPWPGLSSSGSFPSESFGSALLPVWTAAGSGTPSWSTKQVLPVFSVRISLFDLLSHTMLAQVQIL